MAISGCKTQGTQADPNTPTQESTTSTQQKAQQLPICSEWPSEGICFINKEMVTKLIEQGKVNEPTKEGITPLMLAADADSVKALIDAGADVNAKATDGNSVLMIALSLTRSMQKDDGRIQILLNAGAAPDLDEDDDRNIVTLAQAFNPSAWGYTPLMMAWTLDQVKALVEHGADVNAKTSVFQITPLILALGNNQKDIAKYLIEHGADVNAVSKDGMTPLSVAPDEETVNMLLAKGADLNPVTKYGLLLANVNAGKMRALLNAGFDIHTEYFNSTPLILAKDVETAKMLIDAGCDVNAAARNTIREYGLQSLEAFAFESVLEEGTTPLDMAVKQENYELTELLIQSGAKIDATLQNSYLILTPSQKIRELLLKNGLNINAKNEYDKIPLNDVSRVEDAKVLIRAGARIDKTQSYPNLWAIADTELAQILIDQGVDFNQISTDEFLDHEERKPALFLTNDPEVVKLLLKTGADIHVKDADGQTVLMRSDTVWNYYFRELSNMGIDYNTAREIKMVLDVPEEVLNIPEEVLSFPEIADAAIEAKGIYKKAKEVLKRSIDNNREIIKLLIDAGADINASSYYGNTALTHTHDLETIKLLLAAGADPNGGKRHSPDSEMEAMDEKDTRPIKLPLIEAISSDNLEAIKLLLAAGADPNAQTHAGESALSTVFFNDKYTIEKKQEDKSTIEKKRELAQILINAGANINSSISDGTILSICMNEEMIESAKLAIELGADVNIHMSGWKPKPGHITLSPPIIMTAALKANKNPEYLKLFLAAGAEPDMVDYEGKTALFKILTDSSLDIMKKREIAQMLINAGANINHKASRKKYRSDELIHETVITHIIQWTNGDQDERQKNYIESLKLAIELGADVNVLCEENKPLTEQTNNQEVIKILKEAGVKC